MYPVIEIYMPPLRDRRQGFGRLYYHSSSATATRLPRSNVSRFRRWRCVAEYVSSVLTEPLPPIYLHARQGSVIDDVTGRHGTSCNVISYRTDPDLDLPAGISMLEDRFTG